MKMHLYFLLFFLCGNHIVNAQLGGAVLLNNTTAPVFISTGGFAPPEGTFVQVLARPIGENGEFVPLESVSVSGAFGDNTIFELSVPGVFLGWTSGPIDGVEPLGQAEFFVRGWRGATTWNEAVNNPEAFVGQTPVFENKVGYFDLSDMPYHQQQSLVNMPSFTLFPVPEPSTYSLLLTGIGLFALRIFFQRIDHGRP